MHGIIVGLQLSIMKFFMILIVQKMIIWIEEILSKMLFIDLLYKYHHSKVNIIDKFLQ